MFSLGEMGFTFAAALTPKKGNSEMDTSRKGKEERRICFFPEKEKGKVEFRFFSSFHKRREYPKKGKQR